MGKKNPKAEVNVLPQFSPPWQHLCYLIKKQSDGQMSFHGSLCSTDCRGQHLFLLILSPP